MSKMSFIEKGENLLPGISLQFRGQDEKKQVTQNSSPLSRLTAIFASPYLSGLLSPFQLSNSFSTCSSSSSSHLSSSSSSYFYHKGKKDKCCSVCTSDDDSFEGDTELPDPALVTRIIEDREDEIFRLERLLTKAEKKIKKLKSKIYMQSCDKIDEQREQVEWLQRELSDLQYQLFYGDSKKDKEIELLKKELRELKRDQKNEGDNISKGSRVRRKTLEDEKPRKVNKSMWKDLQSEVEKLKKATNKHLSARSKNNFIKDSTKDSTKDSIEDSIEDSTKNSTKILKKVDDYDSDDECSETEKSKTKKVDNNLVIKPETNEIIVSKSASSSSTELVLHLSLPFRSTATGVMLGLAVGMGAGLGIIARRILGYYSRIRSHSYSNSMAWNRGSSRSHFTS